MIADNVSQLKLVGSFYIRSRYIPFDRTVSLQRWVFGGFCDEKEVPPKKNHCEAGCKDGGIHLISRFEKLHSASRCLLSTLGYFCTK